MKRLSKKVLAKALAQIQNAAWRKIIDDEYLDDTDTAIAYAQIFTCNDLWISLDGNIKELAKLQMEA